jgi:hypothetical protein
MHSFYLVTTTYAYHAQARQSEEHQWHRAWVLQSNATFAKLSQRWTLQQPSFLDNSPAPRRNLSKDHLHFHHRQFLDLPCVVNVRNSQQMFCACNVTKTFAENVSRVFTAGAVCWSMNPDHCVVALVLVLVVEVVAVEQKCQEE